MCVAKQKRKLKVAKFILLPFILSFFFPLVPVLVFVVVLRFVSVVVRRVLAACLMCF